MNDKEIKRVKNQEDVRSALCGYIADNIAEILKFRCVIDEKQMEQIKRKNEELFPRKNK